MIVLYVLTKKYYPVSFVAGGFQLDLGGRSSTTRTGTVGDLPRVTYDPAKFARSLDWIVAYGQGNQGGLGANSVFPTPRSMRSSMPEPADRISLGIFRGEALVRYGCNVISARPR